MIYRIESKVTSGAYYEGQTAERIFEVPGSYTLEQLCSYVLSIYSFDFDHLYQFTIGNKDYDGCPPEGPAAERCRIKLYSLPLKKGTTFTLLYDFGDDWMFEFKVLDVKDIPSKSAELISYAGDVEQYPDWEDEDAEDWEEDEWDEDDDWGQTPEENLEEVQLVWDYKAPDELYEAAFQYKKTKLWKELYSDEIFALRFSDGVIGYISIMGFNGEHLAIGIYLGEDGLQSLREISSPIEEISFIPDEERYTRQNCLQVIFDNKEYLREEELAAAKAYASDHGIRFNGKNAFPHFIRFRPGRMPWHPAPGKEEEYLLEATKAAVFLSEQLHRAKADELGFVVFAPATPSVPLICSEGNGVFSMGSTLHELPPAKHYVWPGPSSINEVLAAKIRKIKAQETLQCVIIQVPSTIVPSPEQAEKTSDAPYHPFALFAINKKDGYLYQPALSDDCDDYADRMTDEFLTVLADAQIHPKVFEVKDVRTQALIEPIAKIIKSSVKLEPDIPVFDELIHSLSDSMGSPVMDGVGDLLDQEEMDELGYGEDDAPFDEYEQVLDMINTILTMPKSAIRTMPPDLKMILWQMIREGVLPEDMAKKLKKKLL